MYAIIETGGNSTRFRRATFFSLKSFRQKKEASFLTRFLLFPMMNSLLWAHQLLKALRQCKGNQSREEKENHRLQV